MKKLIRYSLVAGVVLAVALAAFAIAAPYLLGLERIRAAGEDYASKALGRSVTIEDSSFSWAGPRIRLEGFTIADAAGGTGQPLARFASFDLKLRLWELLRLKVSVEHIILTAPRVRLVRSADGRWNFADILETINAAGGKSASAARYYADKAPAGAIEAPPVDLAVDRIVVEKGELFFADAATPRLAGGLTFRDVSLILTDLSLDQPVSVQAGLGIDRNGTDVTLTGSVGPVGKPIVPGRIPLDLELSVPAFDLARVPSIAGPLPVDVKGTVTVSDRLTGTLEEGFQVEGHRKLAGVDLTRTDGRPLVRAFDGGAVFTALVRPEARVVEISDFSLTAGEAVINAGGRVALVKAGPSVDLKIDSEPIPLSGWGRILPDLGAMASLDGDISLRGDVSGVVGRDLTVDMVFVSDRLEVDRGPAMKERSTAPASGEEKAGQAGPEPMAPPAVTVTGKVEVKEGRFEKISFSDLEAAVSQKGTRVSLDDMTLSAFSGRMAGKAWADLGQVPLAYGTRMSMQDVEVNDALEAVARLPGVLFGKVSMDVALDGRGTDFPHIQKFLSGSGSLEAKDGRLATANLGRSAGKAASLLGLSADGEDTPFEDMDATFTIKDGKVKFSRLRLASGQWDLSARGDVGLDRSLALTSHMTLSEQATGKIPADRRKLLPKAPDGRAQLPLKIGGDVTAPRITLDSSAMNAEARREVKQKVEKKKQELKEKLGEDLQKQLKGLFK